MDLIAIGCHETLFSYPNWVAQTRLKYLKTRNFSHEGIDLPNESKTRTWYCIVFVASPLSTQQTRTTIGVGFVSAWFFIPCFFFKMSPWGREPRTWSGIRNQTRFILEVVVIPDSRVHECLWQKGKEEMIRIALKRYAPRYLQFQLESEVMRIVKYEPILSMSSYPVKSKSGAVN